MSYFFTFGTKQFNKNTSIDVFKGTTPFQIANIGSITVSPSGAYPLNSDVAGISTYNNINYNVYTFTNTTTTVTSYTITYYAYMSCTCYVLAVGGGGAGSSYTGGGGGAGGVVMVPVTVPAGVGTITISIGNGGIGTKTGNANTGATGNGSNTNVTFGATGVSIPSIIAYGGGAGGGGSATNSAYSGASGGGSKCTNPPAVAPAGAAINYPYNYGNPGGFYRTNAVAGGGGGAGTPGCTLQAYPTTTTVYSNGGNGIQCKLPGISTFSPSGTSYGSYYWGGGGGGSASNTTVANCVTSGGLGGGGGGGVVSATNNPTTTGGGSALNAGAAGALLNTGAGGKGGTNTGGGGGGSWNGPAGDGGSGIVIISFPVSSVNLYSTPTTSIFTNTSLSTSAVKTAQCALGCTILNNNFFGPTMTLRANNDTYGVFTRNFYADINGTLWNGYDINKINLQVWLSNSGADSTYAYVTMWYDQSMYSTVFSYAIQNNPSNQPIYDIAYKFINFGYTGANGGVVSPNATCYMTLPNGSMPYNDSSFCYIVKHHNIGTNTYGGLISGGANVSNQSYMLDVNAASAGYYGSQVNSTVNYYNLIYTSSVQPNNVLTATYKSFSTAGGANNWGFAINDYSASTTVSTALAITNSNVSIGASTSGWNPNCSQAQISYLFMFNSALSSSDQLLIKQNAGGYLTNGYFLGTTSTASIITLGATPISSPVTTANLNGWYFTATSTTAIGGGGIVLMNSYNGITAPSLGNLIYCYFGKSGGTTVVSYYYINQNLVLYPRTYTLTYYIQSRPTYYQSAQQVFAGINGYVNTPASATTSWTQQTLTFTISTYGTYTLQIIVQNGIGLTDSSIAIAQVTLT